MRAFLESEGVAEDQYELDGRFCDECLCLEERNGVWRVFYAEHGLRSGEREFDSEDDACQFMAQRLLADASTRRRG